MICLSCSANLLHIGHNTIIYIIHNVIRKDKIRNYSFSIQGEIDLNVTQ